MDKEIGILICRTKTGQLVHGPTHHGTEKNVTVRIQCPSGSTPAALWHTHPGGTMSLSRLDIETGKKHKLPYVCVSNGRRGSTKCFQIKR